MWNKGVFSWERDVMIKNSVAMLDKLQKRIGTYQFIFIGGFIIGILSFISLFGVSSLDIFNRDWRILPYGSDPSFTQLATDAFLSAPWSFPLGKIAGYLYPYTTSIVYTDAMPLAAIIAKLFYPLVGRLFQFAGIYGIICFGLQGGFAAILLKKYTEKKLHIMISVVFFSF